MSADKITLYCEDLNRIKPFTCCDSCHEDENEGYGERCDYDSPDGKARIFLCCRAPDTDTLTQADWDKMIADSAAAR